MGLESRTATGKTIRSDRGGKGVAVIVGRPVPVKEAAGLINPHWPRITRHTGAIQILVTLVVQSRRQRATANSQNEPGSAAFNACSGSEIATPKIRSLAQTWLHHSRVGLMARFGRVARDRRPDVHEMPLYFLGAILRLQAGVRPSSNDRSSAPLREQLFQPR